jgi:toxin-antitoxin system PIN domain toxin
VSPYLLDTNVLIALVWPSHIHHTQAQEWFGRKKKAGFRTCPITETGFVRISSNPKFISDAVTPAEAVALLCRITALPEHGFWPDDLRVIDTIRDDRPIVGHRQITDSYLLALAVHNRGQLATFDRGVLAFAGSRGPVELLQDS